MRPARQHGPPGQARVTRKSDTPLCLFSRATTKSFDGIPKSVGNFRLAEMSELPDNSDMPSVDQNRQASRKRAGRLMRTAKSAARKPSAKTPAVRKLSALALDMEVPLREVGDAAHALRLIGYGLEGQGYSNEGRAIADVAWTACQRLEALDDVWRCLC
jgi:hypothetical protein